MVAIHAFHRGSIVHRFDSGLGVVSCKARLAIADDRLAILAIEGARVQKLGEMETETQQKISMIVKEL